MSTDRAPPSTPTPPSTPPTPPKPSTSRQIAFIVENASLLDMHTKKMILGVVMMEVGSSAVLELKTAREVDIDLDAIVRSNPEVITHIYNIVKTRREAMNQPAREQSTR